jgi:hypothetical protein
MRKTQRQLIGLALTGIKAKQIALTKGIMENRGKPFVVEGLHKALNDTFPIRRELEEMMEAEQKKEQTDMFGWVNEALAGLTIRR